VRAALSESLPCSGWRGWADATSLALCQCRLDACSACTHRDGCRGEAKSWPYRPKMGALLVSRGCHPGLMELALQAGVAGGGAGMLIPGTGDVQRQSRPPERSQRPDPILQSTADIRPASRRPTDACKLTHDCFAVVLSWGGSVREFGDDWKVVANVQSWETCQFSRPRAGRHPQGSLR
jgi:hypothetical protein